MKTLILIGTLLAQAAFAELPTPPEIVEIERSRYVTPMEIALNKETVRCLVGDYGARSLKISIEELMGLTVFRHTTRGETLPCINAGACSHESDPNGEGLKPEMILDETRPTEIVQMTIVLKEVLTLHHQEKICTRGLEETVSSHVRGLDFKHWDGAQIGHLEWDVCLKMKELAAK